MKQMFCVTINTPNIISESLDGSDTNLQLRLPERGIEPNAAKAEKGGL